MNQQRGRAVVDGSSGKVHAGSEGRFPGLEGRFPGLPRSGCGATGRTDGRGAAESSSARPASPARGEPAGTAGPEERRPFSDDALAAAVGAPVFRPQADAWQQLGPAAQVGQWYLPEQQQQLWGPWLPPVGQDPADPMGLALGPFSPEDAGWGEPMAFSPEETQDGYYLVYPYWMG